MTREEAIKIFQRMKKILSIPNSDAVHEAVDMAIEALSTPTGEDLIIKGAKGIKDGLYNIQNGELLQYKAKGGTVRAYPIVEQKMGGAE